MLDVFRPSFWIGFRTLGLLSFKHVVQASPLAETAYKMVAYCSASTGVAITSYAVVSAVHHEQQRGWHGSGQPVTAFKSGVLNLSVAT